MEEHKKKMIAPIVITGFIILYYIFYFGILISLLDGVWKFLLGVIPLALAAAMIYVCIERIKEIKDEVKIPLVLHGGSGVPDDQIQAAVKAGITKINFGTDLCYSFLDEVFATDKNKVAIDLFMYAPIDAVKKFAESKIRLLGAAGRV